MEGVPQRTESNIESLRDWRALKAEASGKAVQLLAGIENFEHMSPDEKMETLMHIIEELADNNENRFVADELARTISVIEENQRHTARMAELGVAA